MAIPEIVRLRAEKQLQAFCASRVPAHIQHSLRLEATFRGNSATLYELRPPWRPEAGADWARLPIAQFRYDPDANRWRLYWADRNSRWHEYDGLKPAADLSRLLAEVAADPDGAFWG